MQYDREITITVGNNLKSVNWQPQSIMLSEFYEKLRIPNRSTDHAGIPEPEKVGAGR